MASLSTEGPLTHKRFKDQMLTLVFDNKNVCNNQEFYYYYFLSLFISQREF